MLTWYQIACLPTPHPTPHTASARMQTRSLCRDPELLHEEVERERQRALAEAVVRHMDTHDLVAIASGRLGAGGLLASRRRRSSEQSDVDQTAGVSQVWKSFSLLWLTFNCMIVLLHGFVYDCLFCGPGRDVRELSECQNIIICIICMICMICMIVWLCLYENCVIMIVWFVSYQVFIKIKNNCDIEDFAETHVCKLSRIFRSCAYT